jgi:hypothetical protein
MTEKSFGQEALTWLWISYDSSRDQAKQKGREQLRGNGFT